jgi:hypothetical protein
MTSGSVNLVDRLRKQIPQFCRYALVLPVLLLHGTCLYAAPPTNCSIGPTGRPPLTDVGPGGYLGYDGGLFPQASNTDNPKHAAAGEAIARSIVPLGPDGVAEPVNGKFVYTYIGISLTYLDWWGSQDIAKADIYAPAENFNYRALNLPNINPKLSLPHAIRGQNGFYHWTDPTSTFWPDMIKILARQGVTPAQVQILWAFTPGNGVGPGPDGNRFPRNAELQRDGTVRMLHAILRYFPNTKIVYLSSKHFAWSSNPDGSLVWEPFSHDSAWGTKWAIEQQIKGDPALNYDPAKGSVKAPWITWGPYFWTDAGRPRGYDSLTWTCPDDVYVLKNDFSHQSPAGIRLQAGMLLNQMMNDPSATPWFLNNHGTR